MGRLSIPQETTLFDLLRQCFNNFVKIFAIKDEDNILLDTSNLERVLSSIFDTESRAFVTEKSLRIVDELKDHAKVCLFVQAVTGMAIVFQRLSLFEAGISQGFLSRELELFSENEDRHDVLDKVAGSHLLTSCYNNEEIVDFLGEIVQDYTTVRPDELPRTTVGEAIGGDSDAWDIDRPCKKMGLPWGFTIMAIN